VRYLVGTMVDIGLGERPEAEMSALLDQTDELETSPPAPPEGLFLAAVTYPPDAGAHRVPRGPRLVPS